MNKLRDVPILLSALMTLIACGGGGGSTPTPTPPPTPTPVQKVAVTVSSTKAGTLNLAMSTSFQPAEWDYQFFTNHSSATIPLGNLNPAHVRIQAVSQGIPQTAANAWDFTKLDAILQPVLGVGDHSPEFQVAYGPSFPCITRTRRCSLMARASLCLATTLPIW
jgi:hypothetical protein